MNVTINDIAKKANVSKGTVSAVINEKDTVSEPTREKVLQIIKELNYIPNDIARSLSKKQVKIIGLVVRDINNPFYSDLTRTIEKISYENDYNLVLCSTHGQHKKEKNFVNMLLKKRVDGIIIKPLNYNVDFDHLFKLKKSGIPFVVLSSPIKNLRTNYIYVNTKDVIYETIEYLIKLGHKRIAFLKGPVNVKQSIIREKIYRKVLSDYNIPINENYIISSGIEIDEGYRATIKLLKVHPEVTAIFSHNDLSTIGVFRASKEVGRKIPDNLSIVSVDDIEFATDLSTPLTTVHIPKYEMGETAIKILLEQINSKDESKENYIKQQLSCKLLIRESSGELIK